VLAFVGLCWPSLGYIGLRWPVLAFVGLRWAVLGCVGICWPALAFIGSALALCRPVVVVEVREAVADGGDATTINFKLSYTEYIY
jgi:hypothetical protein